MSGIEVLRATLAEKEAELAALTKEVEAFRFIIAWYEANPQPEKGVCASSDKLTLCQAEDHRRPNN